MNPQPQPYISPEAFLELERTAEHKSEYFAGEIFAMSGGSPAHNQIAVNIASELHMQLKAGPCRVFNSDQMVKIEATGLHTYSDISVVCEEARFEGDILLNPLLLIEVLSDSTEGYDRGQKFEHYRTLASLKEYLLVSQHQMRIEQYTRQADNGWLLRDEVGGEATLQLSSINCALALAEVYRKVELQPRSLRQSVGKT